MMTEFYDIIVPPSDTRPTGINARIRAVSPAQALAKLKDHLEASTTADRILYVNAKEVIEFTFDADQISLEDVRPAEGMVIVR